MKWILSILLLLPSIAKAGTIYNLYEGGNLVIAFETAVPITNQVNSEFYSELGGQLLVNNTDLHPLVPAPGSYGFVARAYYGIPNASLYVGEFDFIFVQFPDSNIPATSGTYPLTPASEVIKWSTVAPKEGIDVFHLDTLIISGTIGAVHSPEPPGLVLVGIGGFVIFWFGVNRRRR
jgi:hypothetical protein